MREYMDADFYTGISASSYVGRIKAKAELNAFARKIAYDHAYTPSSAKNLSKFLKLKQDDSFDSVAVAPSAAQGDSGASGWTAKLMDPEAQELFNTIKGQTSQELLKNFYNSYMAPLGGDIGDRLGPVIKTKQLFSSVYNDKGELVETGSSICSLLGQTDKFGRMDTVSNMRTMVEIEPCYIKDHSGHAHTLTQGYSEYYVNFFFPPYTSEFFMDGVKLRPRVDSTIDITQGLSTPEDNKASLSDLMSQAEARSILTKNRKAAIDPKNIKHFDPVDMMCARDGFTYRAPGFKAVNDNISFLQFLFEQCTGIVSTYMTEWDLSLYMQEGLEEIRRNSVIWLCSRVEEDNPQGLRGEDAFVWGAINAAISKIGVNGNGPANQAIWKPGCYYLSGYWWPSHYPDRGDGLPTFWDYAIRGPDHDCNRTRINTVRGRIKFDDEQHMAFAGWKSADVIQYYQVLYTSAEDGLSSVDQVYLQEPNNVYGSLEDEIKAVQDAVYMDDSSLGWGINGESLIEIQDFTAAGWPNKLMGVDKYDPNKRFLYNYVKKTFERTDPYDSASKQLKYTDYYIKGENGKPQPEWVARKGTDGRVSLDVGTSNDVSIDGAGNISILGVEIPGSSLLKLFLKKDSIKHQAMAVASSTKAGFGNLIDNVVEPDPNNPPTDGSSMGILDEVLNSHPDENKHNSNPMGIPRLGPVLYGGPHGNMSSPQTMQAYFEPNNTFLRTIARVEPTIIDTSAKFTSMDKQAYYQGVEQQYCFPAGIKDKNTSIGRSPSETLHFMKEGYCDSIKAYIWTWRYKQYQHIHPYISANASEYSYTSYTTTTWNDFDEDSWTWSTKTSTTSSTSYYTSVSVSLSYPTYMGNSAENENVPDWIRYHVNYGLWDGGYVTVYAGTSSRGGSGWTTVRDGWRTFDCKWWTEGRNVYVRVPWVYRTGSYHQYEQSYYRRPLMHNIPAKIPGKSSDYSKWRLGKYKWAPNAEAYGWRSGKWSKFLQNWGSSNPELERCAQYYTINDNIDAEDSYYRMTMPYTGENFQNHPESCFILWSYKINGRHNGTHNGTPSRFPTWTDRYHPEDEVVRMMLGNGKNPYDWTKIFYCVSAPGDTYSDRITRGPRAIVQVPTRLTERTVYYESLRWYCEHHSCTCHDDTWFYTVTEHKTYRWIEADLQNAKMYYSSANWSDIYRPDIFANDVMEDVPDEKYRVQFWKSSPLHLLESDGSENNAFQFAGPGFGSERYEYTFGWGLYLAMPGIDPSYPIPIDKGLGNFSKFEDANEYLNISHIYNMYGLGNASTTPIKDLGIFSCQLSEGGPRRRYADGHIFTTSDRCPKVYNTKLMGVPENPQVAAILKSKFPGDVWDQGLYNFLIKMYQSCILFLPCGTNIAGNMQPFTVDIGASVISALKMVKHQKAYLEYTRELFTHTVSAQAIRNILDKSVDRQITLVSNPLDTANYNNKSIYYNYWIEMAYRLYYNSFDEAGLLDSFTRRITSIDLFTQECQKFIATVSGFSTSAENWSFNNFIDCYGVFRVFKDKINLLDDELEKYFYSYLNVLYEYRKYFVNRRFNKQDGSLWMTRQLESIIPMVVSNSGLSGETAAPVVTNLEPDVNQYIVDMKQVSNSIYKKGEAVAKNEANPLDKISKLYIRVVPATKDEFYEFIDSKRITDPILRYEKPDPNNKNIAQIAYLRLPIDGTYKLQSKEYLTNDANKSYNDKLLTMVNVGSLSRSDYEIRKKIVDDRIQDCVFQIVWNDSSEDALRDAYLAATKEVDKFEGKQDAARLEYEEQQRIFEDLEVEVEEENKRVDDEYLTAVRTLENALSEAGGTKERWRTKEFYDAANRVYLTSPEGIEYYSELPKCITAHREAEKIHDKFIAEAQGDIIRNPLLIITPGEDLSGVPQEDIPDVRYTSFEDYYKKVYQSKEDSEVSTSISESEWGIFSESIYNNWGGKKEFRKIPDKVYAQVEAYVDSTFNNNRDDSEYFYDVVGKSYNNYYAELEKCVKNKDDGVFSPDIYAHWDNEGHFRAVAPEILDTVNEFVYAWENLDNFDQDVLDRLDYKNKTYEKNDKRLAAQDKKQKDALSTYNTITKEYNEADRKATDAYQAYQSRGGENETREARIERFTWRQPTPNDDMVPNIIFNLSTGVDPAKLTSAKSEDASVELCRSSKFEDFWVITIPESEQPLDIGFDVGLKIKTYKPKIRSAVQFAESNILTTVAGPFAYSLYPITDAQNGLLTCPGSDLGGLKDVLEGIVM